METEETAKKAKYESMIKRGCGSEEKPTRSTANGKENMTLKPYLRNYLNVDNNI